MRRTELGLAAALLALAATFVPPALVSSAQSSPPPAPAASGPVGATDAMVRDALSAPRRVSYVGQVSSIRWGNARADAAIERVEHKAPDRTRRTYLAPEALYGRYAVTQGTTTYAVDNSGHQIVVTENPALRDPFTQSTDLALLAANYRAVAGPVESVANRPALTVSLVNVHTGERMMRVWIDTGTRLVLATEAYHGDGSMSWRTRFDEIRYTASIPDEDFAMPRDFARVSGRRYTGVSSDLERALAGAGFTPISPKYLPDGFSVIGGDVSDVKGTRSLHLLYSDGIRSLSLFENNGPAAADPGALKPTATRFEGHDAWYVKDGPTTLLAWREHGLAFALVGDLDLRELTAIAESVVP